MLRVGLALQGYGIEAGTAEIGTLSDLLFDETTWQIKWVVVESGSWKCGRKIRIRPSYIETTDCQRQLVLLSLAKHEVKHSPGVRPEPTVSRQVQSRRLDDQACDTSPGTVGSERGKVARAGAFDLSPSLDTQQADRDRHLRSMAALMGHQCRTEDSPIGRLEDLLIDDVAWDIRYLIVNARTLLPGKHVLLSPCAVKQIGMSDSQIEINVSRDQVKASPPWNPLAVIDKGYRYQLHRHYGWPFHA